MQYGCVKLSLIAQYSSLLPPFREFYPCLSVNVAVHTLIPAIDHSLGSLLHHQLTNLESAPL